MRLTYIGGSGFVTEDRAWAHISADAGVAMVSRTRDSVLLVSSLILAPQ